MDSAPPLPLALEETVTALRKSIPELDSVLAPLIGSGSKNVVTLDELLESTVDPLDRAKLIVSLGFALHSCLHAFLRVNGQDTSAGPIKAQVERLKMYFGKVKKAESRKSRPKTDVEAAGRFIQHAIGSSTDREDSPAANHDSSARPSSSSSSSGKQRESSPTSGTSQRHRPAFKPRGRR
ncbi:hypothetical protein BCR44DRAFT_24431 [Catenaria anguillulae PL171]|uniref:Exosome complex protein n=1 Tax=Catenaria anguillulae PL171 TaxID=765915 RepID=A0A1Y2HCA1_9FUNG|nr:hypothetical protein BCR44DRAFT_24431 [Catenaria anguillulae PL171]